MGAYMQPAHNLKEMSYFYGNAQSGKQYEALELIATQLQNKFGSVCELTLLTQVVNHSRM